MRLAETHLGREGAVCPEPILDAGDVLGEYRPGASLGVSTILGHRLGHSRRFPPSHVR